MLPRPCLSFTLPSIHDDTTLDCRVYHPPCLRDPSHSNKPWPGHAAVVAHPYAPLGGSFDDPIVDVAAGTLLQLGFLVATFNFRGAEPSAGRTSWTSKPEQADYISVVGFLAYYVYHLDPLPFAPPTNGYQLPSCTMLLAGYSYGAIITTRLPPLDTILAYFATPAIHTAEADIRLRAQHLAEAHLDSQAAGPASPRKSLGIRVGGDEDTSRRNRDEHPILESNREERIRESVRNLLSRAQLVYRKSPRWTSGIKPDGKMDQCLDKVEGHVMFKSAYLAISPPIGLVTRLATLSFSGLSSVPLTGDVLFTTNPTLVIYGDQDGLISYRRIHEWTRQLSGADASRFRYLEVRGAGHFWAEGDAIYQLRDAIGTFATDLTHQGRTPGPSP
ncbi:Alpha/Beta hydrolase protein [Xylaria cf. heliscus]|nr:Alpha/Beta hydrolase protein [Xylaria cf. heliscus]